MLSFNFSRISKNCFHLTSAINFSAVKSLRFKLRWLALKGKHFTNRFHCSSNRIAFPVGSKVSSALTALNNAETSSNLISSPWKILHRIIISKASLCPTKRCKMRDKLFGHSRKSGWKFSYGDLQLINSRSRWTSSLMENYWCDRCMWSRTDE